MKTTILRTVAAWSYPVLTALLSLSSTADASGQEFPNAQAVLQANKGKIVTSDMLDPAVREELKGGNSAKSPGMLRLDLNGDGLDDLALLVKGSDPQEVDVRFYLCGKVCTEHRSIYGSSLGDTFLRGVRPGAVVAEPPIGSQTPKKLRLKFAGVEVVTYGKGALVYYWDEASRKFQSIPVSD